MDEASRLNQRAQRLHPPTPTDSGSKLMSCIFRLKKLAVAPLALLAGLSACAGAPPVDEEGDPVDLAVAAADLGVAIDGCADGVTSGWVAATGTLTLTMGTTGGEDVLVLSAPGGKIA